MRPLPSCAHQLQPRSDSHRQLPRSRPWPRWLRNSLGDVYRHHHFYHLPEDHPMLRVRKRYHLDRYSPGELYTHIAVTNILFSKLAFKWSYGSISRDNLAAGTTMFALIWPPARTANSSTRTATTSSPSFAWRRPSDPPQHLSSHSHSRTTPLPLSHSQRSHLWSPPRHPMSHRPTDTVDIDRLIISCRIL